MSYTEDIDKFRELGKMSQLTDIENHKKALGEDEASVEDKDLLCTKLSCVSQRDRTYDEYEPEPEQYLEYYGELNCDNENFVTPGYPAGYPDTPLSDAEINDASVKKTKLGCNSDETSIIPEKEGPIPVKEDPQISEKSEPGETSKRLDDLDKKLDELLEQLDETLAETTLSDTLAETTGVMKDNPVEITDKKIKAIEKHAERLDSTYAKFMELFDGNIDDAYNFVTMSGGGYKVKKQRSSKRRSGKRRSRKRRSGKRRSGRKRRSRKRRSVKRSNQHKKK